MLALSTYVRVNLCLQKNAKRSVSKKAAYKRKEVYTYEEYAPAFAPFPSYNSYNSFPAETDDDEPRQCYGPNCVEPARQGSKYCSDDCGLKLATRYCVYCVQTPKETKRNDVSKCLQ